MTHSETSVTDRMSRRDILSSAALATGMLAIAGPAAAQTASAKPGSAKSALVTGSSRGIGASTAKRLAQDGYKVTVNCVVNRDLAAGVVKEIEAAGGEAIWEQADVSDPKAVQRLFDAHDRAFGGVDVVVANAGIMRLAPFHAMTDDDFIRMMDVNVKGGFLTLREAARRVRHSGRIITLSSSITQLRSPTYGPYAASKAAQEIYANVLAKELQGKMVSVNAIAPGVVNTTLFTDGKTEQQIAVFAERTPHKRLGETADIAAVIASLCASDGGWVNGQTVFANGGLI